MGITHNSAVIGVFGVVIVISYGHTVIFAHLFPFIQFLSISNHVVSSTGKMAYSHSGDGEDVEEIFEGMSYGIVQVLGGFQLSTDDPRNYTDKLAIITQERYFPTESYPPGADPEYQIAPTAGPSSTAGPSTSAAGVAPPELDPAVKDIQESLISHHHTIVKMLEKVGVKDVCALYRRSKVDTILQSLGPKDVLCVICKKEFSNKQHLRTHLKSKHFGKTAYFCEECSKYFTDSTSLAAHMRAHDPELKKFKCPKCDKRFITQPKLAEHMPTHGGRVYMCQFCRQKSFKHLKGVREHESTCQANPKAEGPFICRICGKSYKEKRGRKRHMKEKHDDAPVDL